MVRGGLAALRAVAATTKLASWTALRRFRRRQLVRIAWRDLAGLADVDTVLRELSQLADTCIEAACRLRGRPVEPRTAGAPVARDGARLAAAGARHGQARRRRAQFLLGHRPRVPVPGARRDRPGRGHSSTRSTSRVSARSVAQLLGTVTAEGFVYRVDLRLRPFGESGPRRRELRRVRGLPAAARPRLGTLCLREGAARARAAPLRASCTATCCARSSTGATSTSACSSRCAR